MSWSRRRLLGAAGMLAGASAAGMLRGVAVEAVAANPAVADRITAGRAGAARRPLDGVRETSGTRWIVLESLHTPESLDIVFRRGDEYVADAMTAIQALLRDHRTGAQHPIDPKLLDYLHDVARLAGVDPVFRVISGYRSPQTSEMPHERSSGVSSHSLHAAGRAIDVRLADLDCAELAEHSLAMRRGGVGYYRKSDFVHLDTGRLRTWRG